MAHWPAAGAGPPPPPPPAHAAAACSPLCPLFPQDGATLVGQEALDPSPRYMEAAGGQRLRVEPADRFHSFKRLIGRGWVDPCCAV